MKSYKGFILVALNDQKGGTFPALIREDHINHDWIYARALDHESAYRARPDQIDFEHDYEMSSVFKWFIDYKMFSKHS